jgi:hypothetical protein
MKKNTKAFLVTSEEVGLEVSAEKTMYKLLSWPEYGTESWHKGS